ncbi:MAG TPA: peptidylprolyl isomerase [Planctomycetota bacterium]|nr:peptidylprolyl isomerase [Planctomycetota bacterium]
MSLALGAALLAGALRAQESAPASRGARIPPSALASPDPRDEAVARVEDFELRLSDLARAMLAERPSEARDLVRALAVREIVRREAARLGVSVRREDVERGIAEEVEGIRRQVEREGGTLADFLRRELRMTEAAWREALERRALADRFLGLVVRYAGLLEERAVVRVLTTARKEEAEALLAKVREGADFAVLARERSVGPGRADGGKLPPFGRGWDHPIAKAAFALNAGDVGGPVEEPGVKGTVFHLVRLLERLPAREAAFAEVDEEVAESLRARPVERFEYERWVEAASRRWKVEFPPSGGA